jgi:hypothetical protein
MTTTLQTVNQMQSVFWQLATYLILSACLLVIAAAAFAFAWEMFIKPFRGGRADAALDSRTNRSSETSAQLGAAYQAGTHVPAVHVLPKGVARVAPARHTVNRQTERRDA